MNSQWQNDSVRVSTEEADKLVEMWLRRRLAGNETAPPKEPGFSLQEIAQALGAREEDVALLLGQMRAKTVAPKVRPAIPVRQSWRFIGLIYGGALMVVLTGVAFAAMRHNRYQPYFGPYHAPSQWKVDRTGHSYHVTQLPMDFGFEYMYENSPILRITSSGPENWSQGETAILDDISEINSQIAPKYVASLTSEEIAEALKQKDTDQIVDLNPNLGSQGPSEDQANKWVEWHPFTLEVDGRQLRTLLPNARVANADLDKAIQASVKTRIQALFKVMKQKFPNSRDFDPSNPERR